MRWLIAVILVVLCVATTAFGDEYKYLPICGPDVCLEKRPKLMKKNWVIGGTGMGLLPYRVDRFGQTYNPNGSIFHLGYMRLFKDDMMGGLMFNGNDGGVTGWQISIGAGF